MMGVLFFLAETLNPISYVYIRGTRILAGIGIRPWVLGFGATCSAFRTPNPIQDFMAIL